MTLLELLQLLKKRLKLVIALPIVFALATAVYSYVFLANEYTSQIQLYILAKSNSEQTYASSSDTTASQQLANDIAVFAKTSSVRSATAKNLGLPNLDAFEVGVQGATTNRVITLTVTGADPGSAAQVADELAKQTSTLAVEKMGISACNIIDNATVPTDPSGPRRTMYVAVAFLAGLFLAIAIVILTDMIDTTVRSREEAEELFGLSVLGTMPELKRVK